MPTLADHVSGQGWDYGEGLYRRGTGTQKADFLTGETVPADEGPLTASGN